MPTHALWRVSLHGGHSSDFCDHATSPLRDMVATAAAQGFHTYGLAEHAPRYEERFLYPEERQRGWDLAKIQADFVAYAKASLALQEEYAGRMTILRGFEAEITPENGYAPLMLECRQRHSFDYMVGSVHYVDDILVDGTPESFALALAGRASLEDLVVRYYELMAQMIHALRPEVIGHFDVVRKFAAPYGPVDTPPIRRAAEAALEAAREHRCILDLNTGAYRKGNEYPYPAPWLVEIARRLEVPFCFGDDSHCVDHVGAGIDRGREYLIEHGVDRVTILTREAGCLVRKAVPLA